MTSDMRPTIIPKSDQTNTDDLLGGPRTIKITGVSIRPGTEQPVSISYENDNGKPYKPCKSMCRVMVHLWGPDANKYVGRQITLYADPKVLWGGMAVGGIRISHMSDIDGASTMALTATKGSRKPFIVQPLATKKAEPASDAPKFIYTAANDKDYDLGSLDKWHEKMLGAIAGYESPDQVEALMQRNEANLVAVAMNDVGRVEHVELKARERIAELKGTG